jgi:hypothetical protein
MYYLFFLSPHALSLLPLPRVSSLCSGLPAPFFFPMRILARFCWLVFFQRNASYAR